MTDDEPIGYGNPPKANRFKPGISGNKKGRPVGAISKEPFKEILDTRITVLHDGIETDITAEEAFLRKMLQMALEEDHPSAQSELKAALQALKARQVAEAEQQVAMKLHITPIPTESVAHHLQTLFILKKLYAKQSDKCQFKIKNWAVQLAVNRLEEGALGREDQREVLNVIEQPKTIQWPDWWEERGV